jgi:hypothetical protein
MNEVGKLAETTLAELMLCPLTVKLRRVVLYSPVVLTMKVKAQVPLEK